MSITHIDIQKEKFVINGRPTYSEIPHSNKAAQGLLMNARFIQGIFDDKAGREKYARFGSPEYDPERNTDDLISALPEWYDHGLRAFTVGLQGGGPVFTVEDWTQIDNTPFSEDGKSFDPAYEGRLDRLIRAADKVGMVVIVSLFYQAQAHRLRDGTAIRNAVKTACSVLKSGGYSNVIIEVANEHQVGNFILHPIIHSSEGMAYLIGLAREQSGGMPVGSSGGGNYINEEISRESDVILIHGNGCTRQMFYNQIKNIRGWNLNKPIVCNEDSPCYSQLGVAFQNGVSWGYYNNLTKQEPPADWRISPGEDAFFARRIAEGVGIQLPELPEEERYYLQGFEPLITIDQKRWIRLASLYPEKIDYVEFFRNGKRIDIAYDEPFMVNNETDWIQKPCLVGPGEEWNAVIHLRDGNILEKEVLTK